MFSQCKWCLSDQVIDTNSLSVVQLYNFATKPDTINSCLYFGFLTEVLLLLDVPFLMQLFGNTLLLPISYSNNNNNNNNNNNYYYYSYILTGKPTGKRPLRRPRRR